MLRRHSTNKPSAARVNQYWMSDATDYASITSRSNKRGCQLDLANFSLDLYSCIDFRCEKSGEVVSPCWISPAARLARWQCCRTPAPPPGAAPATVTAPVRRNAGAVGRNAIAVPPFASGAPFAAEVRWRIALRASALRRLPILQGPGRPRQNQQRR